ncbi:hypothetical protein OVA03_14000 [Asticcacaulis sp. SL142]|uniref:hypothetical protein n=1 Tax=Asticcacaulis sp. SL142 TaxID=2995155 RepID=UPI00226C75B2|nr:hypothetical protein [Asticcacaulis sp. SL142]WAC47803.1 hypothetical protein OVA03_14000 [Asticcacaulis sp. SL142]
MALTDIALRNAKPMAKPYKLTDEKGPLSSRHTFGWTIMEAEIQKQGVRWEKTLSRSVPGGQPETS